MAETDPPGSLRPTPATALAVAFLFGVLGAGAVLVVSTSLDRLPPQVPWTAPVGLILIAALVGALAYLTHVRIQRRRERIDPQRAVTLLVLGKASALAGVLVAGGYLTYGLLFVSRFDAEAPRDRVIRSLVALIAGVALCVAGLKLERACRVPGDDGDDRDLDLDIDGGGPGDTALP